MELSSGLEAIFRWMHILAGILWIGLLYWFNFVNIPFAATLDGGTKQKVLPELLPRGLFWFRWGAAWTWITGVLLLTLVFYMTPNTLADQDAGFTLSSWVMLVVTFLAVFVYDFLFKSGLAKNTKVVSTIAFVLLAAVILLFVYWGGFSYRGTLIHTGVLFGTIMAFNVWFRIWPAQKNIIPVIRNGEAPDANLMAMVGLRSRHNTYMSVPLFWAMINQHTTYFAGGNLGIPSDYAWLVWLVIILVGWHIVWQLYRRAGKVPGF